MLMNVTLSLNRSYVAAFSETMSHQVDVDAINYGQALADNVFIAGRNYATAAATFQNLDDVNDPNKRLSFVTAMNDTLYATIQLSAEQTLIHGVTGRVATISVFTQEAPGNFLLRTQYVATINPN